MTRAAGRKPLHHFRSPRYWPAWLGLGLLRLSCLLPYRTQLGLGKTLGRLIHHVARERRAIARRNVELCFPGLPASERDALVLAHFEALGASLIELALGRWASDEKLVAMTRVEGAEHIRHALDAGKGVILLSAHFTSLEISGRVLAKHCPPFDAVFRKHRNEFVTELLRSSRERSARATIEKNDIKGMVRSLREGVPVWYAPDQSYHRKQSALLPFFGVPSMTNTATGTLARLGKAVAIPFFPRRLPEGGYVLSILPPIEGLPGDDPARDTRKYVEILERQIRLAPEQYYWVHRKFKNRPEPLPDVYARPDSRRSPAARPVPESVCILRLSALGDVTHVLPVIRTLQSRWPETKICWVIGKTEHQLVADVDNVEFVVFDKARGWREYFNLYKVLKHRKFDYLLLMQVALRANVASLCIPAAVKIGFDRARSKDLHGLFVDERIAPGGREHVVDAFLGFLRHIGLDAVQKRWCLPIPPEGREFARMHAPSGCPLIIVSPCSSHPLRSWDAPSYAAVADYAIERYDARVAICGGPSAAEREMAGAICARARYTVLDLVGKDTLRQFVGLLKEAMLLISPDSGPAHIATCVGTPVLGLYAASNPRRSGPYNSIHWCVDRYEDAARKYLSRPADTLIWGRKIEYPGVMRLITVDDVKLKLDEFMQTTGALNG